jgi:hypothetical protein
MRYPNTFVIQPRPTFFPLFEFRSLQSFLCETTTLHHRAVPGNIFNNILQQSSASSTSSSMNWNMVQIKQSRPAVAAAILVLSSLMLTVCRSAILSADRPLVRSSSTDNTSRKLELVNKSGKKLVVDWVDPMTGQAHTLNDGFADGQSTVFESFVNHTFAIHEPSNNCDGQNYLACAVQYVTVNDKRNQGKLFLVLGKKRFMQVIPTRRFPAIVS